MFDTDPKKNFILAILRQSGNDQRCVEAAVSIAKTLVELYRYFEAALFEGQFFVFRHLNDAPVFPEDDGKPIYNPDILLNRRTGQLAIQLFEDGKLILWEDAETSKLRNDAEIVTYVFSSNHESFITKTLELDISIYPFGSRFATQYFDLYEALNQYKTEMVFRSTCPLLLAAWFTNKLIFFKGGGKDLPESQMQVSLHHFLGIRLRGTKLVLREMNLVDENGRPVDLAVYWGEANRMALIEVKWLGKSKHQTGEISTTYTNSRVNEGMLQLKGYFDTAQRVFSTTIVQAYLVMIDGRRRNTGANTETVTLENGMYYQNVELFVDPERQYYNEVPGFNEPLRMFAAPVIS